MHSICYETLPIHNQVRMNGSQQGRIIDGGVSKLYNEWHNQSCQLTLHSPS